MLMKKEVQKLFIVVTLLALITTVLVSIVNDRTSNLINELSMYQSID